MNNESNWSGLNCTILLIIRHYNEGSLEISPLLFHAQGLFAESRH